MAIPDFQTLMLPLLRLLADGREHGFGEACDALSEEFRLSEAERRQLLPSGRYPLMRNRVGWARTYLVKAGLVESPRRGVMRISARGRDVLAECPQRIDMGFLEQYPEYLAFREGRRVEREANAVVEGAAASQQTPEEALELAHARLRSDLESELLGLVKGASPRFFERLVVELLVRMGYGGSLADAGQAVGGSGDGGIDGIIKEDQLGLDTIYIQAKRWENTVGRPEIQRFAGALQGHQADKGVFITTADFSRDAREYAARIANRIVLIDGPQLAKLMVDHDLGVSTVESYEVKRVDSDYFVEE